MGYPFVSESICLRRRSPKHGKSIEILNNKVLVRYVTISGADEGLGWGPKVSPTIIL